MSNQMEKPSFFIKGARIEEENVVLPLAMYNELVASALRDPLTNLYNRRAILEIYDSELNGSQEGTLILMDIDKFKSINDNDGHQMGDMVLQSVGMILEREFQGQGIVFRLGGDEFGILFIGHQEVRALSARMGYLRGLYKEKVDIICSHHSTSLSYGGIVNAIGLDFHQLYEKADVVLYEAKHQGKDNGVLRYHLS